MRRNNNLVLPAVDLGIEPPLAHDWEIGREGREVSIIMIKGVAGGIMPYRRSRQGKVIR